MGEGFCRKPFTLAASETDGLKVRWEVEMQSAESCAFFLVGSTAVPSSEVKQTEQSLHSKRFVNQRIAWGG